MTDQDVVYSDDLTRLITYQSRSWTMGDISLAAIGGVQWAAAGVAAVVGALSAAVVALTLLLVGLPFWLAPIPALVIAAVVYFKVAKDRSRGLTEVERFRLRLLQRYRQPTHFNGLAADTDAKAFCWDMTLWSPEFGDPL